MILYDKTFFAIMPTKAQQKNQFFRMNYSQPTVTKTALNNFFNDIPSSLPEELINVLIENNHCRIERIVSRGHCTPPGQWYDQDWDEWVLLLQGQAIIKYFADPAGLTIGPGDYLFIPAHSKHRVEWTPPDMDSIWLAIHIHPGKN
jgi:cupin 2 domain-containing protein